MIKIIIFFMVFTLSVFAQENYMKEDGTFDWESYLGYGVNVKERAYNDTNTLIQLFNHYDKVKDDPFSLQTLSNDIVSSVYSSGNYDSFFDYYYGDVVVGGYDSDSDQLHNMYKILYDNMHKFDVRDSKGKKDSLEWFLNNQIHEVKLFYEIRSAFLLGEENKVIEIKLRNSDDETNGLTIKYNGKVVGGILGRRTDYEYTIDYNGKKDVKIKYAKLRIDRISERAILIGENNYFYYNNYGYRYKIRDLNNHEDGITSVEIIK